VFTVVDVAKERPPTGTERFEAEGKESRIKLRKCVKIIKEKRGGGRIDG
jgi:hypothetical protein